MSPEVWISVAQSGPGEDRNVHLTDQKLSDTVLLQRVWRVERATGTEAALSAWELTVSRGTRQDGQWARVMARVPFRTRMSVDLLERYSRIRLCCNACRVWSGWRESNPHCQLGNQLDAGNPPWRTA